MIAHGRGRDVRGALRSHHLWRGIARTGRDGLACELPALTACGDRGSRRGLAGRVGTPPIAPMSAKQIRNTAVSSLATCRLPETAGLQEVYPRESRVFWGTGHSITTHGSPGWTESGAFATLNR